MKNPAPGVSVDIVAPSNPAARWALEQYFAELDARFDGGFDATGALDGVDAAFTLPTGLFLLAVVPGSDDPAVGCVGLSHLDADRSEIKRMWVGPAARGRGLGGLLLARCEREALAAGRRIVVLDTNRALTQALTLYARHGYEAVPRYNANPYADHWFAKRLSVPREGQGRRSATRADCAHAD